MRQRPPEVPDVDKSQTPEAGRDTLGASDTRGEAAEKGSKSGGRKKRSCAFWRLTGEIHGITIGGREAGA